MLINNPTAVKTMRLIPKLSLKKLSEKMVVLTALMNAMRSNQKISTVERIFLLCMWVPSMMELKNRAFKPNRSNHGWINIVCSVRYFSSWYSIKHVKNVTTYIYLQVNRKLAWGYVSILSHMKIAYEFCNVTYLLIQHKNNPYAET